MPRKLSDILDQLADRGIRLWLDGDRLKYRAPKGAVDDVLLESLSTHRHMLIEHLRAAASHSIRPDYSQRAAPGEVITIPDHMKHFWAVVRRGEAGPAYTNGCQTAVRIDTEHNAALFEAAVDALLRRHEILAARAVPVDDLDGEGFVCDVAVKDILSFVDLSDQLPTNLMETFDAQVRAFTWEPFDVQKAMFRVRVFKLPNRGSVVAVVVHHFIVDHVALTRVVRELEEAYENLAAGSSLVSPTDPVPFTSYLLGMSEWLRKEEHFSHHRRYWADQTRGAPATRLPGPRGLPEDTVTDIVGRRFSIAPLTSFGLDSASFKYGASPFMGLLTITRMVLASLAEQDDIVLTLLSDGRNNGIPTDAVGRFSNIVPLRTKCAVVTSFSAALEEVKAQYLSSLPHWICPQHVFYNDVSAGGLAWDAPLINFHDHRARAGAPPEAIGEAGKRPPFLGGEPPVWRAPLSTYSNFHLTFSRMPQDLRVHIQYPAAVYSAVMVERFCRIFVACVESAVADTEAMLDLLVVGAERILD